MEPIDLMYVLLSLLGIASVLILVILYRSRKTSETDYEKEMKKLQLLLKGKLDKKTFLHIKDNLKVEDLFGDETQRLDNLLKEKNIDPETYCRMKQILNTAFNEKLEKINQKYKYIDSDLIPKNFNVRFHSNY